MNCPECADHRTVRVLWGGVPISVSCPACAFVPCGEAPIGVVTNCTAMNCEGEGCAMAKPQVPVSLDDLSPYGGAR